MANVSTYQNTNNAALGKTNYQNISTPDIASAYKAQLSNALNNANNNTSLYQGKVQNALDTYNNAYKVNPQDTQAYKNDMTNSINKLYDTQKNNVGLYYQNGINQAKQQYAGLRDQASVANQQNLNKSKELMASQGLFNSGDNITAQTGINNQYANDLSGYNRQEQNYYDNTNNAIAQQKAQYDAQAAQALIDLGYKADTRDFNLANLYDNRNQSTFNNSMTGIGSMYGMGQDQFNNTLKAVAQQYGMDSDQFKNALSTSQFNSGENQRQFTNSMSTNNSNYGMYNDDIKNNQWQQNFDNSKNQWGQQFDYQKAQDALKAKQWQDQFDYQKQQDAIANQLAQARAAASSGGSGRSSSRSSSGSNGDYSGTDYKNSSQQALNDYTNNNNYTLAQKLQSLSGYANSSGIDSKDAQYAREQQQALLDGRWYR